MKKGTEASPNVTWTAGGAEDGEWGCGSAAFFSV